MGESEQLSLIPPGEALHSLGEVRDLVALPLCSVRHRTRETGGPFPSKGKVDQSREAGPI